MRRSGSWVVLLAAGPWVAGCTAGGAPNAVTGSVRETTSASSATTVGVVPAELEGLWHKTFQGGDQKLAFDRTEYSLYVQVGDTAVGHAFVSGDTIVFSGSDTCAGTGRYRWVRSGATVTFTSIGADPCPRHDVLPGGSWTRLSSSP
jgi:hypothetical protein